MGKYSQFFQKIINPTISENATYHYFCESLLLALPVDSTTAGLRETPTVILHKTTVTHLTPPLPERQKKMWVVSFFSPGLRSLETHCLCSHLHQKHSCSSISYVFYSILLRFIRVLMPFMKTQLQFAQKHRSNCQNQENLVRY